MKIMPTRKNVYKFIVIVAVVAFAILVNLFLDAEKVPPKASSFGRMKGFMLRIFDYVELHNELPKGLHDLPPRAGYDNSFMDGWGNEILYITDANENVTLLSYGKDGTEGGSGEAADIRIKFNPRDFETFYNAIE